jgi:hypothetical protein
MPKELNITTGTAIKMGLVCVIRPKATPLSATWLRLSPIKERRFKTKNTPSALVIIAISTPAKTARCTKAKDKNSIRLIYPP